MPIQRSHLIPPNQARYQLVVHGGAGHRSPSSTRDPRPYEEGLRAAYVAGETVLADGGTARDAVIAAVHILEDTPQFNAGHGAALAADGTAELDACLALGDGRTGAVAACRHAKNPIDAAGAVLDHTSHVLLADPPRSVCEQWGLDVVDNTYFVTQARTEHLARVQAEGAKASRHGTVGAVALDTHGSVAAATSTGGIVDQSVGRVGDTPILGAGSFARDHVMAMSCTGDGEAFLAGCFAHDVYARMAYGAASLEDAVAATVAAELDSRASNAQTATTTGGFIAVLPDGTGYAGHSSDMMLTAFRCAETGDVVTWC